MLGKVDINLNLSFIKMHSDCAFYVNGSNKMHNILQLLCIFCFLINYNGCKLKVFDNI